MNHTVLPVPDLENRFLEPEGWRWHTFKHKDRTLRFGSVFPKDEIPSAVVVCLPGLSEFCEKYFETARTCLNLNLAFWVLDWAGQGASSRFLDDPQKRHSTGFADDVADLHYFVDSYVKPASVHPDRGRIPRVMLAQSMGGHIGLHYLHAHPEVFTCAAFCAPMFGIKALAHIPDGIAQKATAFMNTYFGTHYVCGASTWDPPRMRPTRGPRRLSTDPVRNGVHTAWFESRPALQTGFVTYGWVREAYLSCKALENPDFLKTIQTPCLIAQAGKDHLVDNQKIDHVARILTHADYRIFPESHHEILMEKENIRQEFFTHFQTLIRKNILERPETLKPF